MKHCDEEAKRKCVALIDQEEVRTMQNEGIAAPVVESTYIIDKNANMLIKEIDAKNCEIMATKEKAKERWEWVDQDARNCFYGRVGAGALKCMHGLNYHRKQNTLINKGMVESKCPRCREEEDWEYVIACPSAHNLNQQHIAELQEKLSKVTRNESNKEDVEMIIDDTENYVMQGQND